MCLLELKKEQLDKSKKIIVLKSLPGSGRAHNAPLENTPPNAPLYSTPSAPRFSHLGRSPLDVHHHSAPYSDDFDLLL